MSVSNCNHPTSKVRLATHVECKHLNTAIETCGGSRLVGGNLFDDTEEFFVCTDCGKFLAMGDASQETGE